jgi:4-amino-4-deoxy-L-arabinose transferase-like glycosyltransferase
MFCCWGLVCFAKSWVRIADGHSDAMLPKQQSLNALNLWPRIGWSMMGLAILCKGPQLPLILVIGWMLAMILSGDRRSIFPVLRPVSGIMIAASASLWWFILVWRWVPGSGHVMTSETLGRILDFEGEPLRRYLEPYYFYRTTGLIAPWVAIYVLALASPWIREIRMTRSARLLWCIVVFSIAIMHITVNRRWYYLLPLTGALSGLMAWSAIAVGRAMIHAGLGWLWRVLAASHIVCLVALGAWYWRWRPDETRPSIVAVTAMTLLAIGILLSLFVSRRWRDSAASPAILATFAALVFLMVVEARGSLWSNDRFARRDFSRAIAGLVPESVPLLGWFNDWQSEQYYLHRPIPTCRSARAIREAMRPTGVAWVLVGSARPLDLPSDMHQEVMRRVSTQPDREVQLRRITAPIQPQHGMQPTDR